MKYKKDKTKVIQVRLTDADLTKIDEIATREKRTRSDVVRLLISGGVSDVKKAKVAI